MMCDTLGRESDLKADYQRWTDADAGVLFTTTTATYASTSELKIAQLTGGGALTKTGAGTLILADAVLGAVAVEEGRIALNGRVVSTGRFFVSQIDLIFFEKTQSIADIICFHIHKSV